MRDAISYDLFAQALLEWVAFFEKWNKVIEVRSKDRHPITGEQLDTE